MVPSAARPCPPCAGGAGPPPRSLAPAPPPPPAPHCMAVAGVLHIPPANVPEADLFNLMQRHRKVLVAWFDVAGTEVADRVLHNIVKLVLRGQNPAQESWAAHGVGRFVAPKVRGAGAVLLGLPQ